MPLVSVIIPCYNAEKFLPRCLDSITRQSLKDIEIICINDGSTDDSLNILQKYASQDSRIRVISQKNSGLSATRNRALKIAKSEYISFIDSDDWIDLNYLEILLNLCVKNDADIGVADMHLIETDKRIKICRNNNEVLTSFSDKISHFPNGSVCNKLIRKNLFDKKNMLFPVGRLYEDNIVLLKLAWFSKKVVFTNQVSYFYLLNNSGICRNSELDNKRSSDKIYSAQQMMNFITSKTSADFRSIHAVKTYVMRTVADDFIHKNSPYFAEIKQILGHWFVFGFRLQKLIRKIFYIKRGNKCL